MNITLVSAKYDSNRYRKGENLGIKAIEAILCTHNHKVYIYDENFVDIDDQTLISLINSNGSKIVGFSVSFTHQIYETIRLAQKMRDKLTDIHFTIGGQGVSFIIQDILKNNSIFDSGICFEGELTFLELIQYIQGDRNIDEIKGLYYRINNEVKFNGYREPIVNLDQLPFMHRDIGTNEVGVKHITMLTSRGCMGKCLFCSSGYFSNRYHNSKKWRYRSAKNIVQEIENFKEKFQDLAISFVDDNFLGGSQEGYERAKKYSEMLINRKLNIKWSIECRVDDVNMELFVLMQRAGLMNVFLGIESGNKQDLRLFNKNISLLQIDNAIKVLRKLGLTYDIGFIMFHPTSTVEQLITNATFLRKYNCANSKSLLNELSLYHGSPLIKYYDLKGLITYREYSVLYSYENPLVKKILDAAKKLLSELIQIETQLERLLFQMQNIQISLELETSYIQYLNIRKKLSDFEANIFIDICKKSTFINNIYYKLEEKIKQFKLKISSEIEQIGG